MGQDRGASGAELLLVDNRDSFTWNLAQAFEVLGATVTVVRSDVFDPATLGAGSRTTHVVIGPGPGSPAGTLGARRSLELCRGRIPWLGVCLGHQVLAEFLGARVVPTGAPFHGKRDRVEHDGAGIFRELPRPFVAARYHSLAVDPSSLPASLRVVARSADDGDGDRPGTILAIGVPGEATWGVQFHPESFMTPAGPALLAAFLAGVPCPARPVHEGAAAPAAHDAGSADPER